MPEFGRYTVIFWTATFIFYLIRDNYPSMRPYIDFAFLSLSIIIIVINLVKWRRQIKTSMNLIKKLMSSVNKKFEQLQKA